MYCPLQLAPETLTPEQVALIPKIPLYRKELLAKVPSLQKEWDKQGRPLLMTAVILVGKPFTMQDLQAAVFLCPRYPFMGTPLALNVISYMDGPAKDISALGGTPMPIFLFVSTTFHEILHKYVNDILAKRPSRILAITNDTELYETHLHVFALQKAVFEALNLAHLLPSIGALEASHGNPVANDYARAWKAVHESPAFAASLLSELKR